ncbi:hypothetical protein C8R46DRAFT_946230 [Mycena filopes]|nr:hypothetical protein C8R46DRAFT_946230 [Mycena filopes]
MSLLEADRQRIVEMDAQISELEAALSDLRGRKAIVQERLESYTYPVLTLPPEIVSEIFTHFLPTYPDCPHPDGRDSPTRLTQICRAWREISLGTPSLWRAVCLWPRYNLPPARLAREFETWTRRSRRYPMAVDLEFLPDELISELLISIAAQRARLEHLLLHVHDVYSLPPLSGPMPRLRYIDLNFDEEYTESRVLAFSEVPLLRTVLITFNPVALGLPWAQLTSLTLRCVYPRECCPVLEQSPNLIFCHLSFIWDDDETNLPGITLRSLTTLKLAADPFANYLYTFTVPSLCCLDITEDFLGPTPLQYLASFISKSGCSLQELIMREGHSIPRSAYRKTFPSINFSFFGDDEKVTKDSESESSDTESE